MPDLTQIELQNLRKLIDEQETTYQKLNDYSKECTDLQNNYLQNQHKMH